MATAILKEFASFNNFTTPNTQTHIKRIGSTYFSVKTQVFPTLKVENSFNVGMTFSTP